MYQLFNEGDYVQIPAPNGETIPAKVIGFDFGESRYKVRVPESRYCQYSGLFFTVPQETMLRYNPTHSKDTFKTTFAAIA